jgi:hypothetical protein
MDAYVIAALDLEQSPPTVVDVFISFYQDGGWPVQPHYAALAHISSRERSDVHSALWGMLKQKNLQWTHKYPQVARFLENNDPENISKLQDMIDHER